MTRNQAIEIARQRALNAREGHGYLPVTEADAQTWMPHEWVIDAILLATMQCDLAAQQAEPSQTIYCAEKRKPGGCQLHNLHCGWPKCNESPQQAAQPVAKPDGRLHDDGLFTWARRDGYVLDAKLPCDFYLSAQPQQAEPVADVCTDPDNCKRCKTHPNHRGDLSHAGIGWYPPAQPQQAPLKERPDFVAGYDAGLADGRRIAEREQAAQPVAPSDPAAHAVVCVAPNGLERAYDCARSAVADGFSEVGISHVLTGRQKTHGGCVWRLAATKTTPEA